jgi:anti-sigma factor RsiW
MSGATPPVGEDDLHAYIDGQLPAPRRQAVEAHLAAAPQDARRVAAYRAQRQALRQAFAQAPADGPIPERLRLDTIIKERQHRQPRRWLIAASIVLAIGIGAAGGTLFRNLMAPGRNQLAMTLLEQEAVASHTVYAADRRHPVEVAGTEQ